jgi:hypothetical protein
MKQNSLMTILICVVMIFSFLPVSSNVNSEINTEVPLRVINTGYEGEDPVVDENYIVFRDFSPYADPSYVYYHDVTTGITHSTGIEGYHWGVDIPYIVIYSPEWTFGDVNGDGDADDYLYQCYNINTKTSTVFTYNARIVWPMMDNGIIGYSQSEVSYSEDFNGDGLIKDSCGFYYDVKTGVSTYFADALWVTVYGDYIIYDRFASLFYYNVLNNTAVNIGLDTQYPHARFHFWKCDKDIIAFQIDEGAKWGEDLNGDGDTFDMFSGYYNISTGKLKIITDIENRFADISEGKILIYTETFPTRHYLYNTTDESLLELVNYEANKGLYSKIEGNIVVGNDNRGPSIPSAPPRIGVPNILIYDSTTQKQKNTGIIGDLDQFYLKQFDGDIIAFVTYEANIPEDLNLDGDINDHIIRYIIEAPIAEATIDIDPNTLNLKSRGRWITTYIELSEGYNVNLIDVSTILLEDTISAQLRPTSIGDYDDDGIPDLMVKFDRSDVIDMLSPGTYNLKVTGELEDGSFFKGYSDLITVTNPPKARK